MLLSTAATWAGGVGAKRIIIGTARTTTCRGPPSPSSTRNYRREFNPDGQPDARIRKPRGCELIVEAPLAELTRQEIVLLGRRLKLHLREGPELLPQKRRALRQMPGLHTRTAGSSAPASPTPCSLEPAATE